MTQYAKGDTVYLIDGTECEFVIATSGGYLVNVILLTGHDGEMIIDPQIVSEIFPEPPRAMRVREIEILDQEIADREKKLTQLGAELRSIESRGKHFKDLTKRHEALQFVEAFLENRITHLVSIEINGNMKLQEFTQAIKADKQYDTGLKLLSLYGKSGGDLQWRLHQYSTEERNPTEIFPFFSTSSAIAFIQTKIDELTASYIVDNDNYRLGNIQTSIGVINLAYETDLKLPKYVVEYLRKKEKKSLLYRKERLLEELHKVNKDLGEE